MLTNSGVNSEITGGIASALNINKIFGTLILFFAFIAISIFLPSTSGLAYTVFGPIAAPALYSSTVGYSVSGGIASASIASGLANLFSPSAPALAMGCEMAKVPFKYFYKTA
jgi:uncharacterized ion transporter superfamily protein YfcC